MLIGLYLLNEMRPSVRMKRLGQAIAARLEGEKLQRKYRNLLHQLPEPEYKPILMPEKQYIKSDLDTERVEELYLEITGKRVLPKNEIHKLDAFFEKDENGYIALYYSVQQPVNQNNNA